MSQYADETADLWNSKTVRARKPHKCDACKEEIPPGSLYQLSKVLYDGAWDVTKRCARCEAVYRHLCDRMGREGDYEEYCDPALGCGHSYQERWEEEPPPEIAALAFALPGETVIQPETEDGHR